MTVHEVEESVEHIDEQLVLQKAELVSNQEEIDDKGDEEHEQEGEDDDDEPDEWDQRIIKTGCDQENLKLQLCHADTGDWRQCIKEMEDFRKCWDKNNNNQRTSTVDNDNVDF